MELQSVENLGFVEVMDRLSIFGEYKYYDEPHVYTCNGVDVGKSVTGLIHAYETPFDSKYWLAKKSAERGITEAELKKEWDYKAKVSTVKGTMGHDFIENFLSNKIMRRETEMIFSQPIFESTDPVTEKLDIIENMMGNFCVESKPTLIPIKSEFVIGDPEYDTAGMLDQLFYNRKTKMLHIWDWKTNKEIRSSNRFQSLVAPLQHLEQCELVIYSLQTSIYRHIIEKRTGIQLGDSWIGWFFEENDGPKFFKCHDLRKEAEYILSQPFTKKLK
jgi:hypothetical protein